MEEFKSGSLHSGSKSGPVVRSRKQAIAIGLSEERKAKGESAKPKRKKRGDGLKRYAQGLSKRFR